MVEYYEMIKNDVIDAIVAFNNDEITRKLESLYGSKSFLEIIGSSRKELVHSNFIAWVLNPKNDHDIGDYGVSKFLELLSSRGSKNMNGLADDIIVGNYELSDVEVYTEYSITGVGRVDVLLLGNISVGDSTKQFRIIIENKVGSKEHSDQTQKYFDFFESISDDSRLNIYVFLTPISTIELDELESPQCVCDEYLHINYQLLVDYLFSPILSRSENDRVKNNINEYLLSLSQPSYNDTDTKKGSIMALGLEERELLSKFWDKNQKLILAAFYAISSDPDQDLEVRNASKKALDFLSISTRDRSKYNLFYKGVLECENVSKSDIGLKLVKLLDKKDLIDREVIEFLKDDKTCGFHLLKTLDEISPNEKKYRRYKWNKEPELLYENKGFFVARNWGMDKPLVLLKKIQDRFPDLTYELHV